MQTLEKKKNEGKRRMRREKMASGFTHVQYKEKERGSSIPLIPKKKRGDDKMGVDLLKTGKGYKSRMTLHYGSYTKKGDGEKLDAMHTCDVAASASGGAWE